MTTETQMCDVCGKPVEFVGGTINPDGSITEEHLCGDCWVAQQELERDDLSEFVYTERDGIRLAHMIVDFYEMKDDFEASTDNAEKTSVAHRAEELCKSMVSLAYDIVKATSQTERKETDMTERKEKGMEKTKANDTLHVSIAITGNGGCGKSYLTDELEDFFKSAGFEVSVHDDVPTNVDINDVLNGDTHQIVIANQDC